MVIHDKKDDKEVKVANHQIKDMPSDYCNPEKQEKEQNPELQQSRKKQEGQEKQQKYHFKQNKYNNTNDSCACDCNSECTCQAEELKQKECTIKELTDILQRLQAEFENYKKRVDKDSSELGEKTLEKFFAKLLPVIDSFSLCLKNTKNHEELVKGLELVYSQFYSVLEEHGLKPIEAEGKKFDPYLHEALLAEESEKQEGIVLEELQKGFMLKDKVLRHTKVKVAKKK